eukprot:TRINITY_DN7157_c0_g1_i1.p1 TRINITY_DN7157_c0_g1~~TRINITY_DN7157_c0_g1_i1.p1  ORF type:complete len:401 (+),score=64.83 TRINITY_DN7157_c0_g1_i1:35-1237(+)
MRPPEDLLKCSEHIARVRINFLDLCAQHTYTDIEIALMPSRAPLPGHLIYQFSDSCKRLPLRLPDEWTGISVQIRSDDEVRCMVDVHRDSVDKSISRFVKLPGKGAALQCFIEPFQIAMLFEKNRYGEHILTDIIGKQIQEGGCVEREWVVNMCVQQQDAFDECAAPVTMQALCLSLLSSRTETGSENSFSPASPVPSLEASDQSSSDTDLASISSDDGVSEPTSDRDLDEDDEPHTPRQRSPEPALQHQLLDDSSGHDASTPPRAVLHRGLARMLQRCFNVYQCADTSVDVPVYLPEGWSRVQLNARRSALLRGMRFTDEVTYDEVMSQAQKSDREVVIVQHTCALSSTATSRRHQEFQMELGNNEPEVHTATLHYRFRCVSGDQWVLDDLLARVPDVY